MHINGTNGGPSEFDGQTYTLTTKWMKAGIEDNLTVRWKAFTVNNDSVSQKLIELGTNSVCKIVRKQNIIQDSKNKSNSIGVQVTFKPIMHQDSWAFVSWGQSD